MNAHERERLSAYLDGELPPEERASVEGHLRACGECAALLAEMGAVDEAARNLPVETPPGYFEAFPSRLRARLEAQGAPRTRGGTGTGRPALAAVRRRLRLPTWAWAAAAALLLAVVAPLTVRERPLPAPASPVAGAPVPRVQVPATQGIAPPATETTEGRGEPPPSAPALGANAAPVSPARPGPAKGKSEAGRLTRDRPTLTASSPAQAVAARAPASSNGTGRAHAAPMSQEEGAPPAPSVPARRAPAADAAFAAPPLPPEEAALAAAADAVTEGVAPAAPVARVPVGGRARLAPQGVAGASVAEGKAAETEVDRAFARLLVDVPGDAAAWRARREAWRRFLRDHEASPYADEAWVRMVEAGFEARTKGGQEEDAIVFERDARAYLARPEARQRERVRGLLDRASGAP